MNAEAASSGKLFSRGGKIAIGIVSIPLLGLVALAIAAPPTRRHESAPTPATVVAPAPGPVEISPMQRVLRAPTLAHAIGETMAHMTDTTDGPSAGALMLAIWLRERGTWADVAPAQDETSLGKVKKDSEAERGKRMCARGTIVQIAKEQAIDGAFSGNIFTSVGNVVNFVSFGSTGELVARSRARFCGIVTGNYAFENVAGGQTQSVQMVGAFDLPENRPAAPSRSRSPRVAVPLVAHDKQSWEATANDAIDSL